MPFDLSKFESEKIQAVIGEVEVPNLKRFFKDDEKPVFKVRGVDSIEFAQIQEDVSTAQKLQDVIKKLASDQVGEVAEAVKETLGKSSDNPRHYLESLGYVEKGCVEPKLTKQQVVRLAAISTVDFYQIAAKVKNLSGEPRLGELKGSGKNKKSEQQ